MGDVKSPNCPRCGRFMDKIEAWICTKCGDLKVKKSIFKRK